MKKSQNFEVYKDSLRQIMELNTAQFEHFFSENERQSIGNFIDYDTPITARLIDKIKFFGLTTESQSKKRLNGSQAKQNSDNLPRRSINKDQQKLKKELKDLQLENQSLKFEMKKLMQRLSESKRNSRQRIKDQHDLLTGNLSELKQELDEFKAKSSHLENELSKKEARIQSLQDQLKNYEKVTNLKSLRKEIKDLKTQISILSRSKANLERSKIELVSKNKSIKTQLDNLEIRHNDLVDEYNRLLLATHEIRSENKILTERIKAKGCEEITQSWNKPSQQANPKAATNNKTQMESSQLDSDTLSQEDINNFISAFSKKYKAEQGSQTQALSFKFWSKATTSQTIRPKTVRRKKRKNLTYKSSIGFLPLESLVRLKELNIAIIRGRKFAPTRKKLPKLLAEIFNSVKIVEDKGEARLIQFCKDVLRNPDIDFVIVLTDTISHGFYYAVRDVLNEKFINSKNEIGDFSPKSNRQIVEEISSRHSLRRVK